MRAIERKIVIVTRPTRLAGIVAQHATAGQALFKMSRAKVAAAAAAPRRQASVREQAAEDVAVLAEVDKSFAELKEEDVSYSTIVSRLRNELADLAPVYVLDRQYLPTYVFGPDDVIVT